MDISARVCRRMTTFEMLDVRQRFRIVGTLPWSALQVLIARLRASSDEDTKKTKTVTKLKHEKQKCKMERSCRYCHSRFGPDRRLGVRSGQWKYHHPRHSRAGERNRHHASVGLQYAEH